MGERGEDFASTVRFLSESPIIHKCYYIIAGVNPGEGAIIQRDNSDATNDKVTYLGQDPQASWFLINSNWDIDAPWEDGHQTPSPFRELFDKDLRLKQGYKLMADLGSDAVSAESLWNVMSDDGATTIGTNNWAIYNPATIHTEI